MIVFASDVEKPRVWRCPLSFEVHLSPGEQTRPVSWVEPHFTDNVGVEAVFRTKVQYNAESAVGVKYIYGYPVRSDLSKR